MSTAETQLDTRIAERFALKAIVEACLVLEEGDRRACARSTSA